MGIVPPNPANSPPSAICCLEPSPASVSCAYLPPSCSFPVAISLHLPRRHDLCRDQSTALVHTSTQKATARQRTSAAIPLSSCFDSGALRIASKSSMNTSGTAPSKGNNAGRTATCLRPTLPGIRRSCSECGRKKKRCDGQRPCR